MAAGSRAEWNRCRRGCPSHECTRTKFAVTWDYRCPFARNGHEHILDGLEAGADWDVTFVPFFLNQTHVPEGGTPAWDDPAHQPDLLVAGRRRRGARPVPRALPGRPPVAVHRPPRRGRRPARPGGRARRADQGRVRTPTPCWPRSTTDGRPRSPGGARAGASTSSTSSACRPSSSATTPSSSA